MFHNLFAAGSSLLLGWSAYLYTGNSEASLIFTFGLVFAFASVDSAIRGS